MYVCDASVSSGNCAWLHTVFLIVLITVALIILSTFWSLHFVPVSQRSLFEVALHLVMVTIVENEICNMCAQPRSIFLQKLGYSRIKYLTQLNEEGRKLS